MISFLKKLFFGEKIIIVAGDEKHMCGKSDLDVLAKEFEKSNVIFLNCPVKVIKV